MAGEFTHLHLHTQYSLLDGAIRVKDLFPKVLSQGMKSVAMTDHGNMYGAVDFYAQAKKNGVKPIFGCETYVSSGKDRFDKASRKAYHLILLAKNEEGYQNLTYLNSKAFLEGMYYHPRIDLKLLRERSKGLIGLSACLGSEISNTVRKQGIAAATEKAREYASIFDEGDFFLEVMPIGLAEQDEVNDAYRRIGRDTGIPVVATNDCHYVERGDYKAHDVLMCIQTKQKVSDEGRLHHKVDAYYVKSPEEMEAAFSDWPEVLENSATIAARCNVELSLDKPRLPAYQVPDGHDPESFLEAIALEGLARRFGEKRERGEKLDPDQYRERLHYELGVIRKMGFSGYFLVVWDFIRWAKEHKIPVGPGRGSGAGSVVAWSLRITDLDPLAYKLLFERFLNPERKSMPDFDIDFCMNRRDEVIRYVSDKYGADRVGQIATFHQLKSRGVVRDVARALDFPLSEADKIAKLVPEPKMGKPPTIDEALAAEPRLKELYEGDFKVRALLDLARSLEGLTRHVGMHAAGIVIGDKPLWELVPCFKGDKGELVTQFAKEDVERAGLVKFDLLGLTTLTVIETAVRLVNERLAPGAEPLDLERVPLDDRRVYEMISAGETTGVFQLESSGFRDILKQLKPDCMEDIIAAVALYRPGPLEGGMVKDFIARKHGKQRVTYPHPSLAEILEDTHGVVVYQEQVMQIAQVLAGYSLGQADILRKAMGKKNAGEMAKAKVIFLDGARAKDVSDKVATEVFDLLEKFAGYGFNRSHSAAYALITYHTAYLKAHHPHELLAGLMSCAKDDTDSVVKYIAEARAMAVAIARPDVNESVSDFGVVEKGAAGDRSKVVQFGLGAVRGVGEGAVEAIVHARGEGGPYRSMYDFANRVDAHKVNRRTLEALVKAGAFDEVGRVRVGGPVNRAQTFLVIESAMERGAQEQKDRRSGQTSLFGLLSGGPTGPGGAGSGGSGGSGGEAERYPPVGEWAPKELLAFEKESLGFYLTGHPLDRFQADLGRYATANTSELERFTGKELQVALGGIVVDYRDKPTKSGKGRVGFFKLEDQFGQVEVVVFPNAFDKFHELLSTDEPVLIKGKVKDEGEGEKADYRLFLDEAVSLAALRAEKTREVHVFLDADEVTKGQLEQLKTIFRAHPGSCTVWLHVKIPMRSETLVPLGKDLTVAAGDGLLLAIDRLVGERRVMFR